MTGTFTRITLVRHAESQMNRQPWLIGGRSNHTPLTPEGAAAAVALGAALADGPTPDVVVHTSAARSLQTARCVVDGAGWNVPVLLDDGLLELSRGVAEGQPRDQWWTPEAVAALEADPWHHRLVPGGETHHDVQERMAQTLRRLAGEYRGQWIFAVGHGIAIRALAWSLLGGDHDSFRTLELPNLSRVELQVADDGGRIRLAGGRWKPHGLALTASSALPFSGW